MVEIWLTNEEKRNEALREKLRPLYRKYKENKYLVAVFESGERNLTEVTSDLLCYTRKRLAQTEARQQQRMAMSM